VAFWNRKDIEKAAPPLPAGAVTTQYTPEQLAGIANQAYNLGVSTPLPRQPFLSGIPFGPSNPLIPSAINPVGADGQPEPRRWEYPVAWNIFVTEQRAVPWKVLRVAADQIDLLRRCVEVLKNKVSGMDWDITFSESASEAVSAEFGGDHVRAMQQAREKYGDDIARMREFWQTPDRINGLSFKDWLSMALEEILVLDALSIYPHPDMKGDLHSLEILDGSTIKPLLDDRGMRPQAPFPAYQQILYGFPRGEFTATSDDPNQDGVFNADELIYLIRNRRTFTPYGYSPVERALPLADIYIKRQQWLRAEFTDGVMSELMLTPDKDTNWTPDLLRAYENIINDDLAGQTEQRHRARILPPGLTPINNSGFSEKFSAQFDEYLIKGVCGHFGVLPTEIGYADGGALGGAGQQNGEAESGSTIGVEPLIKWLEQQISDISYKFLGMPRELVFQFDGGRTAETTADAQRRDVEVKGGQRTLNEARAEMGLPLLDAAEADVPMLLTSQGVMFITPDGVVNPRNTPSPQFEPTQAGAIAGAQPAVGEVTDEEPVLEPEETEEPNPAEKADSVKVGQMVSWNSSGGRAEGKVTKVVRDGKINVPNSSFTITGTPDDPAALIRVYRDGKPTDTLVGHKVSTLRIIGSKSDNAAQEVKAFIKWAKKGMTDRDFEFLDLDPVHANAFNRAAKDGDIELVKSLADVVLKKA
jgi:hypothetical protein